MLLKADSQQCQYTQQQQSCSRGTEAAESA